MNAHIALIDDDRSWLEALSEYLRRKGFSVSTSADPADGLALLGRSKVSVVICDFDMPGMNGLELVRLICQQPYSVAVLMLSSQEQPSLASQALAAGARGFLAKTVAPAQLVRKLRQIVEELDALASPPLHVWQRLLPSPSSAKCRRNTDRPAA
jgi:DNA-binding NarL/FixJ family response regulator